MPEPFVVTLSCPDRVGIVHAVTGLLVEQGANITETAQFNDASTGLFFMRVRFDAPIPSPATSSTVLRDAFADHAMSPAQLTALGRDTESAVLARAVVWHAERRVLQNGHKTVVFR